MTHTGGNDMLKRLLVLVMILGAVTLARAQEDEPSIEREIGYLFDLSEPIFEPEVWRFGGGEELEASSYLYWRLRGADSQIFMLQLLHFDDGYSDESLEDYFDDAYFDFVLTNYTPHERLAQCESGDIRLFEYKGMADGDKILLRYWAQPVNDTRVMLASGSAPTGDLRALNDYAARLFPGIPSCEALE